MLTLGHFVGRKVVGIRGGESRVVIKFDDGSELIAGEGDSGTMRDPAPYFYVELSTEHECSRRSAAIRKVEEQQAAAEQEKLDSAKNFTQALRRIWPKKKQ